jgi:hypothetical protein
MSQAELDAKRAIEQGTRVAARCNHATVVLFPLNQALP